MMAIVTALIVIALILIFTSLIYGCDPSRSRYYGVVVGVAVAAALTVT